ncbi:MAG: DUF1513 domain-containing protein [Alphaproteobacteria bacterium]|nr:DUF1513 domain-containing protein [Alphaproteobacteria bacterium]
MLCSRRAFLAYMSAFAVTACAGPMRFADSFSTERRLLVSGPDCIFAFDLATRELAVIQTGFLTHSFLPHTDDPEMVLAIERWGRRAAEINLADATLTRRLTSPEKMWFFGHGIKPAGGDTVYISGVSFENGHGYLMGYDARSLEPIVKHDVANTNIHECHILPDGTAMVASSGVTGRVTSFFEDGKRVEPAALVHVDLTDGRVLGRKVLADPDQTIGHFAQTGDGGLLALTRPMNRSKRKYGYLCAGHIDRPGLSEIPLPPELDGKLNGEMLSVAIDKRDRIAAVTNPGSGTLLFIDLERNVLRDWMACRTQSVAYDGAMASFIATPNKEIMQVDTGLKTLSPLSPPAMADRLNVSGSHSLIV